MASEDAQDQHAKPEYRIVLVGKTGVGKSAVGNTITGRRIFESRASSSTVTFESAKETAEFEGQMLSVVDTPGLFDTKRSKEEVAREIATCISLSAPGPHVFLIVLSVVSRFTEEEKTTVKIIREMFGEDAACYTMVLFTSGDNLVKDKVTIDDFIDEHPALLTQPTDLRAFTNQCGGGYHVFNNRDEDRSQVRELLVKINTMVQSNGGGHYINEMFEAAKNAIQEEAERLRRETPDMTLMEARRQAERNNEFIHKVIIFACGAAVGGVVGGAAGFTACGVYVSALALKGAVSLASVAVHAAMRNAACPIQ